MKKLVLILSLFFASTARADFCGKNFVGAFAGNQPFVLCKYLQWAGGIEVLAGAGTTQATATVMTSDYRYHQLTGANGTVGWMLPVITANKVPRVDTLLNTTSGVALIYPEVGGTINGAAANAPCTAATGIKPIICFATAISTWACS